MLFRSQIATFIGSTDQAKAAGRLGVQHRGDLEASTMWRASPPHEPHAGTWGLGRESITCGRESALLRRVTVSCRKWIVGLVLAVALGGCAPELTIDEDVDSIEEGVGLSGCTRGEDHAADLMSTDLAAKENGGLTCANCHTAGSADSLTASDNVRKACASCHVDER